MQKSGQAVHPVQELQGFQRLKHTLTVSIGGRLMLLTVTFASILTLLASAYQLRTEYDRLTTQLNAELDGVEIFTGNIGQSIWGFDEEQLLLSAASLLRMPNVVYVEIRADDSPQRWTAGTRPAQPDIERTYLLKISSGDDSKRMGELYLVATMDTLKQEILRRAYAIIFANALVILSVAAVMLFLFRRLVTQRLTVLNQRLRNLGDQILPGMEHHDSASYIPHDHDELATVEWVLDTTSAELRRAISSRDAAQQRSQEAVKRLQAVLDAAIEVSIIATDAEGTILVFNRGAEKMLGYSAEEMVGQSPAVFHRPSELKQRASELARELGRPVAGFEIFTAPVQATGVSDIRNWTYVRKDKGSLRVSLAISVFHDDKGAVAGYLGIARDVTEQLAAEAKQLKLTLGLDTQVKARTIELQQTLTELQEMQHKLVESEKLAGLGSIVVAVSHELNTPLGNCLVAASTMEENTSALKMEVDAGKLRKARLDEFLHNTVQGMALMQRNLERCGTLVSNFKRIAVDKSSYERRRFDLKSLVDELIANDPLCMTAARFVLSVDEDLLLDSYPVALREILHQFISNSLRHGFVRPEEGVIQIDATRYEDHVLLHYHDNGVGMGEDILPHVFDPFFTTTLGQGGNGLGMFITYNMVTSVLDARITLTSSPGHGCCISLMMPMVAKPPTP